MLLLTVAWKFPGFDQECESPMGRKTIPQSSGAGPNTFEMASRKQHSEHVNVYDVHMLLIQPTLYDQTC